MSAPKLVQTLITINAVFSAKSAQVLDFPIEGSMESIAIGKGKAEWITREIAICFKLMFRYSHGYTVLGSDHLELILDGSGGEESGFGFVNFVPDADHREDSISRMFTFCNNSLIPGQWISMCFDLKFGNTSQRVRVYMDGDECLSSTFEDGNYQELLMSNTIIGKTTL